MDLKFTKTKRTITVSTEGIARAPIPILSGVSVNCSMVAFKTSEQSSFVFTVSEGPVTIPIWTALPEDQYEVVKS